MSSVHDWHSLYLTTIYFKNSLFSFDGQHCIFSLVLSLMGRYFYRMNIIKMFEVVFSFDVKDNNIFPCLHNIRLPYNI